MRSRLTGAAARGRGAAAAMAAKTRQKADKRSTWDTPVIGRRIQKGYQSLGIRQKGSSRSRLGFGLARARFAQIRKAVGMSLSAFGADNSLVLFGHLPQKSGESIPQSLQKTSTFSSAAPMG